jgi:hypothetical protein
MNRNGFDPGVEGHSAPEQTLRDGRAERNPKAPPGTTPDRDSTTRSALGL